MSALETTYLFEKDIWQAVFDTVEDIVLILNENYQLEAINNKGLKVFKLDPNQVKNKKCYELICGHNDPPEKCPLNCARKNKSSRTDHVINVKGRTYKVQLSSIINENSGRTKYVDVLHDITEHIENEKGLKEHINEYQALNEEYLTTNEELKQSNEEYYKLNEQFSSTIKKLAESESKYRAMFEESTLGIFKTTFEGKFIEVNQAFADMFGYQSPTEVVESVNDIKTQLYVNPENRDRIIESIKKPVSQKLVINNDFYKKDGSIIHTRLHYKKVSGKGDVPGHIEGFIEDITAQQKYQDDLNRFTQIIQRSPAVAFRWRNDKNWTIDYVSENAENLIGYSATELISGKIQFKKLIHPDDIKRVENEVVSFSKKIGCDAFRHDPYRIKNKKGEYIWVDDRTFINRKGEEIEYYEGVVLDCSELVMRSHELAENEHFLTTALRIGRLGNWNWNLDTNEITWSKELYSIYGIKNRDLTRKISEPLEQTYPEDIEKLEKAIQKGILTGMFSCEYRIFRKDNRKVSIISAIGETIIDLNGQKHLIGVAKDITEESVALKSLRESEQKFRLLTDQSVDMILLHDFEGKIISVNYKAVLKYGYSKTVFLKMHINDLFPDDMNNIYNQNLWEQLEFNDPFIFETEQKSIEGELFFVEAAITKLEINNEKVVMASFRDISDRIKLQRQMQLHTMLINSINDFVTATDLDGIITYVNDTVCNVFNKEPEELIGQHIKIFGDGADMEGISQEKILEACLQDGNWQGEVINVKPDGTKIILDCRIKAVSDDRGKPIGFIGISTDISERKFFEEELISKKHELEVQNEEYVLINEELEESLSRIRKINVELKNRDSKLSVLLKASREVIKFAPFESTAGQLIAVSREYTNSACGFVILSDDMDDKDIIIINDSDANNCIVRKEFLEKIKTRLEMTLKNGNTVIENKLNQPLRTDNNNKNFKINNVLLIPLLINNKPVGIFGLANKPTDYNREDLSTISAISEFCSMAYFNAEVNKKLLEAKQKAEESDRLKSAFLANMSHEIRTPLNGILGFTDLMCSRKELSVQEKEKYSGIIKSSTHGLLQIINDILDISHIESGQMEIKPEIFGLNQFLNELYDTYLNIHANNNIKIKLISRPLQEELLMDADRKRLAQVFNNLISNAYKFTDAGEIEFGIEGVEDGKINMFVRDTGIGISADKQQLIFDRFMQINEQKKGKVIRGNGLGLAISKNLLQLMQGDIFVESTPDEGSVFKFWLPYSQVFEPTESQTDNKDHKNKISNLRILLVEDDDTSQLYISELLDVENVELVAVNSCERAMNTFQKEKFDLILMDIRLPDGNGLDTVRQIRKTDDKIYIIAQTAYAMYMDEQKAIEAGCNSYLSKPLSKEALFAKIHEMKTSQ